MGLAGRLGLEKGGSKKGARGSELLGGKSAPAPHGAALKFAAAPRALACAEAGPPAVPTSQANQGKSTNELLQQLYAEADEEGKAALSKAWEDGREKREAARMGH